MFIICRLLARDPDFEYSSYALLSSSNSLSQGSKVMEEQDLRELGIHEVGHRRKILQAARSLPKVKLLIVFCFPASER